MKNIRKLIPKGILPSRKKLMELSKEIDAAEKTYEERQNKYYGRCKKIRKVTETSWKKNVKMVNDAINKKLTKKDKDMLNKNKCPNCFGKIVNLRCDGGGTENYGCRKCGNRYYLGIDWVASGKDKSIMQLHKVK